MRSGPQNLPDDLADVIWLGKQPRPDCYPPNAVIRNPNDDTHRRAMATDETHLFYGYLK